MSQRTETICDQCGARKGETNHWWKVEIDPDWIEIRIADDRDHNGQDACSQACAYQAIASFFDSVNAKRKFDADMQTLKDVTKDFDQSMRGAGY